MARQLLLELDAVFTGMWPMPLAFKLRSSVKFVDSGQEQALIEKAKAHVDAKEYGLAEAIYRQLLDQGCRHPQVYSNLAVICGITDRKEERLRLLEQAVKADPNFYLAWLNRGVALAEQRDYGEARDCFRRALALDGNKPLSHAGLGLCLGMLGQLEEAMASYQQAVELGLDDAKQSYFNLGRQLFKQERFREAIQIFRAGLCAHVDDLDSLLLLGMSLQCIGEPEQAAETLLYLLSIDPAHDEGLSIYGHLLSELGHDDEALDLYQRALDANPQSGLAANLLGQLHSDLGRPDLAIPLFQQALENDQNLKGVLVNLATAYRAQGDLAASIATFQKLLAELPGHEIGLFGLLFTYSIGGESYAQAALDAGTTWWNRFRQRTAAEPSMGGGGSARAWATPLEAPAADGDKFRIGILSAEFSGHCVTTFLNSYLRHYDRDRFVVEAITPRYLSEPVEQQLRQQVSDVIKVYDVSYGEARSRLLARRYDLILETTGLTRHSALNLLAERCAPVQCHYIGYHATTALDSIDYFIGDEETASADLQDQFVETLWRLPRPWLACTPGAPFPLATATAGGSGVVLGSFNQLAKVREETLTYWLAALQAVPNSRLLVKDKLIADPVTCQRLSGFLEAHGIDRSRLELVGRDQRWHDHLACYNRVDIALDATPWSSATTGFDALAMGVPLVAIRGQCLAARMSSSLVKGIGRPEWVASNPAEFGRIVKDLAADPEGLRRQKPQLQETVLASSLYDAKDLAAHLDQALRSMIKKNRLAAT